LRLVPLELAARSLMALRLRLRCAPAKLHRYLERASFIRDCSKYARTDRFSERVVRGRSHKRSQTAILTGADGRCLNWWLVELDRVLDFQIAAKSAAWAACASPGVRGEDECSRAVAARTATAALVVVLVRDAIEEREENKVEGASVANIRAAAARQAKVVSRACINPSSIWFGAFFDAELEEIAVAEEVEREARVRDFHLRKPLFGIPVNDLVIEAAKSTWPLTNNAQSDGNMAWRPWTTAVRLWQFVNDTRNKVDLLGDVISRSRDLGVEINVRLQDGLPQLIIAPLRDRPAALLDGQQILRVGLERFLGRRPVFDRPGGGDAAHVETVGGRRHLYWLLK